MKKRTFIISIIGIIISVLMLAIGIGSLIIENYMFFFGLALSLSGILSLSGSLISYYYHDRLGGIIILISSLLYFFAYQILNYYYSVFYFYDALWLNGLILILVALILNVGIFSIYRMNVHHQGLDNSCFGKKANRSIIVLISSMATIGSLAIVFIQLITKAFFLSTISIVLTIGFIIAGLIVSQVYKSKLGSILMSASLWFSLSVILTEINSSNVGIIFMLLALFFQTILVIFVWCSQIKQGVKVDQAPTLNKGD